MDSTERTSIWTVRDPARWPEAPAQMTVTTLAEIEACPRRWALSAADYPRIWSGRGYPPRPQASALAGTVVHLALETITIELVRAACPSAQDPKATRVMKALGSYTMVVQDCIGRVLDGLNLNPRAAPLMESTASALRAHVSELRTRVQTILCRVRLPRLSEALAETGSPGRRGPLRPGAYPEIELRAQRIRWRAKADLLVLSNDGCEIMDFKTGAEDEGHRFQVRVYALLWSADEDLNPTRRRADRLVLRYGTVDVDVPAPTADELDELERQVVARRDAAFRSVSMRPPEARPTTQNCRLCSVRHLCSAFWEPGTQRALAASGPRPVFQDVEIIITGQHGPLSWDAIVEVGRDITAGRKAVLRTKNSVEFRAGDRVRILDAAVIVDDESFGQPAVITLGALSETYAVS